MRDVRGVFAGFAVLALVAAVGLVVARTPARAGSATRSAAWRGGRGPGRAA